MRQEEDYYEDSHGNKIVGNYVGLKFVFSGFNSLIEIGENVQFRETEFYIHNDSRIIIGDSVQFRGTKFVVYNNSRIIIGDKIHFVDTYIRVLDMAKLEIKNGSSISTTDITLAELGELLFEDAKIKADIYGRTNWFIGKNAKLIVGNKGDFNGIGICSVYDDALLCIGTGFSINRNYRIIVTRGTSILIGNDCMCSFDVCMWSNDGHSIFDVSSKKNVNSTEDINKSRSVVIGNHVWIGERACILYNTHIGDGSIIGAMSLVKSTIPNNCIIAGVPAKVIKKNIAWSRKNGAEDITVCGQEYIHYTKMTEA